MNKKGLTQQEKRNYAQGMNAERKWKGIFGKKEKPEITKAKINYNDKELNKAAKKCFIEFGSSCNIRYEKGLNLKCIICLKNRGNY